MNSTSLCTHVVACTPHFRGAGHLVGSWDFFGRTFSACWLLLGEVLEGLEGHVARLPRPAIAPGARQGGQKIGFSVVPSSPLLAPSGMGAKERVSHPSSPSQNPNRWRSIAHFLVVMRFDSPSCTSAPIFSLSVKSQARNKRSNGEENINKNLRRSPPSPLLFVFT